MNRMTVVYHMATPRSDGKVVVSRIGKLCADGVVFFTMTHSVTLTPEEARQMAKAMRDYNFGRFFKEDIDSVEVWCEAYEGYGVIWKRKGGAEVCEDICCLESGGDGWSWDFAQALDEAASEAEGGQ